MFSIPGVESNREKSSPVALSTTIVFRVVVWGRGGIFAPKKYLLYVAKIWDWGYSGGGDNQDESVSPLYQCGTYTPPPPFSTGGGGTSTITIDMNLWWVYMPSTSSCIRYTYT